MPNTMPNDYDSLTLLQLSSMVSLADVLEAYSKDSKAQLKKYTMRKTSRGDVTAKNELVRDPDQFEQCCPLAPAPAPSPELSPHGRPTTSHPRAASLGHNKNNLSHGGTVEGAMRRSTAPPPAGGQERTHLRRRTEPVQGHPSPCFLVQGPNDAFGYFGPNMGSQSRGESQPEPWIPLGMPPYVIPSAPGPRSYRR